jgi:hypothetical protein
MKEKVYYKVCTCTQEGDVTYMDIKLLLKTIKGAIQVIFATKKTGVMVKRGLLLGDLCESTGHYGLAIKIWRKTLNRVTNQDWEDWLYTPLYSMSVRLEHVTNRFGAMQLGLRMDHVWVKLKHPEMATNEQWANDCYDDLWNEKYYESFCDYDETIDEDWDKYTTCSWIDDVYHNRQDVA